MGMAHVRRDHGAPEPRPRPPPAHVRLSIELTPAGTIGAEDPSSTSTSSSISIVAGTEGRGYGVLLQLQRAS